jgi:hypothetical protein
MFYGLMFYELRTRVSWDMLTFVIPKAVLRPEEPDVLRSRYARKGEIAI